MLEKIFGPCRDYSLFVLRLFVGGVFIAYGALKLFGGLQGFAGGYDLNLALLGGLLALLLAGPGKKLSHGGDL